MPPSTVRAAVGRGWLIATLLVIGAATWSVVSTYALLSQTADEPMHVASGLEWYQLGVHRLKPENPPLAQVSAALSAYLDGRQLPPSGAPYLRGTELLYDGGDYIGNLVGARLGALPFFLLAMFVVWLWAQRLGGRRSAFLVVASFGTLPPFMGHAGLATTDVPAAAMILSVVFLYTRWLEGPTARRSALLGVVLGLTVATKFSILLFFPACAVAIAVLRLLLRERGSGVGGPGLRRWLGGGALAAVVGFAALWAIYRFSIGSLDEPPIERLVQNCFPNAGGLGRRFMSWLITQRIPAPDFVLGLLMLYAHMIQGQWAYLLGQGSQFGFWYFYPVVLVVKTPLTFAVLSCLGVTSILRRVRECGWEPLAPALSALVIVVSAMPSSINLGVRHILVAYPLLAVTSGVGLDRLLRRASGRRWLVASVAVVIALGWQLSLMVRVHPNYLAYFNPLAGSEPGRVLLDSDLDWGQDVLQLARYFENRHVDLLHIACFGSVRLCEHGLPPLRWLYPGVPVTGWIAISEMYYRNHWRLTYPDACDRPRGTLPEGDAGFEWLRDYEPVAFAGRSFRIYHIPE